MLSSGRFCQQQLCNQGQSRQGCLYSPSVCAKKPKRAGSFSANCNAERDRDISHEYAETGLEMQDVELQWDVLVQLSRTSGNIPLQLMKMRMLGIDWEHRIKSTTLEKVYLIMFNTANCKSQGVYSIQISGASISASTDIKDLILAFECYEDAVRYVGLLEALMTNKPSVYSIGPSELMKFCQKRGHVCWLQPEGAFITPPEKNTKCTNWERDLLVLQLQQEISKQRNSQTPSQEKQNTQLFWSRDDEDDAALHDVKSWLEHILSKNE